MVIFMAEKKEVIAGKLYVTPGRIEPSQALAVSQEWQRHIQQNNLDQRRSPRQDPVLTLTFNLGYLTNFRFPQTAAAIDELGFRDPAMYAYVNYQPAYAPQDFHTDREEVEGQVFTLQCSDNGSFDFAPGAHTLDQAKDLFTPLATSAGDLVEQRDTTMLHRGRNLGAMPRITIAFAVMSEGFPF